MEERVFKGRYSTEEDLEFIDRLWRRGLSKLIRSYADIVLNDKRRWDEQINVVAVKERLAYHVRKLYETAPKRFAVPVK